MLSATRLRDQIYDWDDATFLDKARLARDGGLTRAAILLLGKYTSTHLLSPHMAEVSWKLVGEEEAYQHFPLPFLLAAADVSQRIRNVQIRLLPPNELIYREISKYNQRSLLEAIYNCIAHQDYMAMSRIIVIERVDRVEFISVGNFFDRTPEAYMLSEQTPRAYRNPYLVSVMTELNLIDHMGNGIHRIAQEQIRRFLPLPTYDLSDPREVKLTIHGAVIDPCYSRLLMERTDLPLEDIVALDRVQKGLPITDEAVDRLRTARLIEGRRPHLRVSQDIAKLTGQMPDYLRRKPQADTHYAKLVLDLIDSTGSASAVTSTSCSSRCLATTSQLQKGSTKVSNLLTQMRRAGQIRNVGSRAHRPGSGHDSLQKGAGACRKRTSGPGVEPADQGLFSTVSLHRTSRNLQKERRMKLQFKVQQYQTEAVDAVVDVFAGQPYADGVKYRIDPGKTAAQTMFEDAGLRNAEIVLTPLQLLVNVQGVQQARGLAPSKDLRDPVKVSVAPLNLDIEMETGTGKTYVYTKTIMELHKRYGWSKYIVVVPSIAIREGVKKSFDITAEHLQQLYGTKPRTFIYNSSRLHELERFSSDAGVQVMIINIQAFNATGSDARRIYEVLDDFQSRRPMEVIAANRPILIIDEPQKIEGDAKKPSKSLEALARFNSLFALRYSATHKIERIKVHRLDAVDAYNQKLRRRSRCAASRSSTWPAAPPTCMWMGWRSARARTSRRRGSSWRCRPLRASSGR